MLFNVLFNAFSPMCFNVPSMFFQCVSRTLRITKAIIMMVVCTGTMKINFFAKDPQALAGGTGII